MLLRRITKHVKDQNWFAVGLDFFIVVVGILIAFQITNWNDHRLENQREGEILERLREDFRQIEADTIKAVSYSQTKQDFLSELAADLTQDPERFFEDDRIEQYLQYAPRRAVVRTSLTYRQLGSSGDIALITSERLRVALDEYEHAARAHRDAESWFHAMNSGPNVKAARFEFLVMTLDAHNAAVSDAISERIRAHLRDPEVIDGIWGSNLVSGNNLYWHQQVLASVRAVLDELDDLCANQCDNTKESTP